jgi:hypothetical protein
MDTFLDVSQQEFQANSLTEKELQSEIGPGTYELGIGHMNKTYSTFFSWQKSDRIEKDEPIVQNSEERHI